MLRRALLVIALGVAGQALPGLAATGSAIRPVVETVPVQPLVQLTTERLVAVTWDHGSRQVSYRWHTPAGWGSWERAEEDTGASPHGTPGTAPLWRPAHADLIALRAGAGARVVRVFDGRVTRGLAVAHAQSGRAILGAVRSRAEWGADESMRRGHPSYAAKVEAVVVHHTANPNGYSPEDVPALIRADYAYHVQARGWDDLGYNLLVDQFGGVWEGRAGGLGKATIGAHAEGFNTGTLGVALIGDLTQAQATNAAERALARVIGYAAGTWHFDPTGSVTLTSRGSPKYASGSTVLLRRAFGHQETSATACPAALQSRLPQLRSIAKIALGPAPVIRSVDVSGAPVHAPAPLVIDAQLSRSASWAVTVTGPDGSVRASAAGEGTAPRLSWNGLDGLLPALPGSYGWAVRADDGVHVPVSRNGSFEVGLPLAG